MPILRYPGDTGAGVATNAKNAAEGAPRKTDPWLVGAFLCQGFLISWQTAELPHRFVDDGTHCIGQIEAADLGIHRKL